MDIKRLEAFRKVYELGSFSLAAKELFLSQPTISAHVSYLERELGVQLFDRMGRTVLPTEAGRVLYGHCTKAIDILETARMELQLLQEKVVGELTVGASTIPAHYLLPRLIADFTERHADVRCSLRVGVTAAVVEQILAGDYTLGVVGAELTHPDLDYTPIMDDELICIAPVGERWANARPGSIEEMAELPWVMREKGSGTRQAFETAVAAAGGSIADFKVRLVVESTQAVLGFVRAGIGVGITSRLAAQDELEAGVISRIELPFLDLPRRFYLVRHTRRSLMPVARYFIQDIVGKLP
jgi:DNA-binding transcriptional LysR family regulator